VIKTGLNHRVYLFISFKSTVDFDAQISDHGFCIWREPRSMEGTSPFGPNTMTSVLLSFIFKTFRNQGFKTVNQGHQRAGVLF